MLRSAPQRSAVFCSSAQCCTVLHSAAQCSALACSSTLVAELCSVRLLCRLQRRATLRLPGVAESEREREGERELIGRSPDTSQTNSLQGSPHVSSDPPLPQESAGRS